MIDVLQFIFGSFWRWAGTVVLIIAFAHLTPLIKIVHVHKDGDE